MDAWPPPASTHPVRVAPYEPHRPPPSSIIVAGLAAVPVGAALGVVLGWWCRRSAGQRSVAGVLAELGAPWMLAAFGGGAVVMIVAGTRRTGHPLGSAIAGAAAGSTCLVAATVVYYGPARTGRFDVSGARSPTVVWATIGIGVGIAFGALGALWWTAPTRTRAACCLVAVGSAVTSEAYYLLDAGGDDRLVRAVVVAVAVSGAALPLLAGVHWMSVAGVVLVVILALPGSTAAEVVSRGALDTVVHLRALVARARDAGP